MPALIDLTGQRCGRATVLMREGTNSTGATWQCRCDCGRDFVAAGRHLKRGLTTSCGCFQRERAAAASYRHGHSPRNGTPSRTYAIWSAMLGRCQNRGNTSWKWYGARGITVCDRWWSFENFLADMGEAPRGLSLDRIDNDGNYEPANCRWATRSEQNANQRPRPRDPATGRLRAAALRKPSRLEADSPEEAVEGEEVLEP